MIKNIRLYLQRALQKWLRGMVENGKVTLKVNVAVSMDVNVAVAVVMNLEVRFDIEKMSI